MVVGGCGLCKFKFTRRMSIHDDVYFELEMIHQDEVNVDYFIQLLAELKMKKGKDYNTKSLSHYF